LAWAKDETMKGYELAMALERESAEIATPARADLVYQAAQEIRSLIEQNKQLTLTLEKHENTNENARYQI
jgi:hypothetical protein